ncbi:MAG: VanW family protein [Eggerthellaceae bacterium]|nr:VanW family protein [Eggerthellaceae bacterium]
MLSNRVATIVAIVLIVLVVGGIVDSVANMGKAYGNVSVNGVDVGGMTSEEIDSTLRSALGPEVSHAQVKVYASEDAQRIGGGDMTDEERLAQIERIAQAEQISVEQATAAVQSWTTDALTLKANVPYEQLVEDAMAVGREDGGIISRLGLFFMRHDVPVNLEYDEGSVEALASEIDRTIGDARIDATVAIEEGVAHPVEGHDGQMVDRDWLKQKISEAMVSGSETPSFVAQVTAAPSRITFEQAQVASDGVNKALQNGAVFSYKGTDWEAYDYDIGNWTRVETVKADNGGFELSVHIDDNAAIPAVVKGAGAAVKSDNVTVKFAKADDGNIVVRTFGPGNIPEVTPAIDQLDEALYGEGGVAWSASLSDQPVRIEITESDAPAALTLDQAIDLGIVTVIGEYTTEFSNYEGTENRNHNIKLVADILDNGIVEANGGQWRFNDRSGDTNEEAGFWAAGSIIEGEYVDSIGGGICQVATTIFNAAYEAGLPIDMRFPHQLYIASYPPGRDASVSYPDLDLWWTNDLASDVLLDLSYTDTSVTARIYSVYTGYTVESTTSEWQVGALYGVKFEEDPDLANGESYVKTTGEDGSSITVTRIVRNEAGEVISDQDFESSYDPKDEVVVIGPGTDTKGFERTDTSSAVSYRSNEYWG